MTALPHQQRLSSLNIPFQQTISYQAVQLKAEWLGCINNSHDAVLTAARDIQRFSSIRVLYNQLGLPLPDQFPLFHTDKGSFGPIMSGHRLDDEGGLCPQEQVAAMRQAYMSHLGMGDGFGWCRQDQLIAADFQLSAVLDMADQLPITILGANSLLGIDYL